MIPFSMRQDMLTRIHKSHKGVEGSLRRASENIFWPGMNTETRDFICHCEICRSLDDKKCKETLISHKFHTHLGERLLVTFLHLMVRLS